MAPLLSYCVVNTNGREHLLSCLDAIERTHPAGVEHEVLVLDNASDDGSAEAVSDRDLRLFALEGRTGKGENDSTLLRAAGGRYCLLLNEDSELHAGAATALIEALEADPAAAAAGAQLLDPDGSPSACAWRLPGLGSALAGALFLHRLLVVQSGGDRTRPVGWCQSSALLVRREAAEQVGYLDPAFFVYSDETDFCKRLGDAGWRILFVPAARATHHDQLATEPAGVRRRIVEFHRNRDLYLRKHHSPPVRLIARALGSWFYGVRALVALVRPGDDFGRWWTHAVQELRPGRGEGVREAAEARNRELAAAADPASKVRDQRAPDHK
jgi:GT2 family glycosyltransferase